MADIIQFRRDTAERWMRFNPVLRDGELGIVTDNHNQFKIGDGMHAWNDLPLRGFNGNIVQETGEDESAVMSQKAVTENLSTLQNQTSGVGYVYCDTPLNMDIKSVTVEGLVELTTGIRLLVKMHNSNVVENNVMFDINSLGAKPLYYNNEHVSASNTWKTGEVVEVYYDGTNFYAVNILGTNGDGSNLIIEWETDSAVTRKKVPEEERKAGLQISYLHPDNGWITERFIGTGVYNSEWEKDDNWEVAIYAGDIQNLTNQVQHAIDMSNAASNLAEQNAAEASEQGDYAKEQGDYAKEMADYIAESLDGNAFIDITEIITALAGNPSSEVEVTITDGLYTNIGKASEAKVTVGTMSQAGITLNFPMTVHKSGVEGEYELDIFINQLYYSTIIGGKASYVMLSATVGSDKQMTVTRIYVPITGTGDGTKFLSDDGTYKEVGGGDEGGGMYVIDGTKFSGSSGTVPSDYWTEIKPFLDKAATTLGNNVFPSIQVFIYMALYTLPVVVNKDDETHYNLNIAAIGTAQSDGKTGVEIQATSLDIVEADGVATFTFNASGTVNTALMNNKIDKLDSGKADWIKIVDHGTEDSTFELTPNVLHKWGEVASLTLTLGEVTSGMADEYMFQFTSGATATQLSLPDTVKWVSTPEIAANTVYQVSIVDNLAVMGGWSNE